ncbi:caspase family protein [Pseudomonas hormoni]
MKKALIIGIDDYPTYPLKGCVNDATEVCQLLKRNADGSPNFSVRLMTSKNTHVSCAALSQAISELFRGAAGTVVLYFAGHGIINPETNAGYIVSADGGKGAWGVSLSEILGLANDAHPRIASSVIILDSCHSGFAGEVTGLNNSQASFIGTGVTILTACHRDGTAQESQGRGVFTDILLDGLRGSCSDVVGNITPAALYSHVDQTLGPWEQRPIYKANVQTFITLRQVAPKIPFEVLRRLPEYFPERAHVFRLDPSYEPDRQNFPADKRYMPIDEDHVRIFKELQKCNRHGLIIPVNEEHMYYAALNSTGCKLTPLGAHYRKLAEMGRI